MMVLQNSLRIFLILINKFTKLIMIFTLFKIVFTNIKTFIKLNDYYFDKITVITSVFSGILTIFGNDEEVTLFGISILALLFCYFYQVHFYRNKYYYQIDSIAILSCHLDEGEITNELKKRLDLGIEMLKNNINEKDILIILSGKGKGMDVECNKMREYLIENKITSEIICENKSINTIQNLEFTNILLKNYSKTKTVVISSDYHIPRIKNLSKLNDCYLFSGSKTDKNIIYVKKSYDEIIAIIEIYSLYFLIWISLLMFLSFVQFSY